MSKRVVKLFPDYCSSGVWLDGCNADPEELGISPALELALNYWHEMWEFTIAYDFDKDGEVIESRMSKAYIERWANDGRKLAKLMSAENEKYEFIYVP